MTESDEERPNALLTSALRKYLRGESDPEGHREYNARVRRRLEASIEDLQLLREHYPVEEMDKVAEEVESGDVWRAASFLDVLGEKAETRHTRTYEDVDEMKDRISALERQVSTLAEVFQGAVEEMSDVEQTEE